MMIKKCVICNNTYEAIRCTQKYCSNCVDEYRKEANRIKARLWYGKNKNRVKNNLKKWRTKNPDIVKKQLAMQANKNRFGGNRLIALERDNYTCQLCGSEEKLIVHHIDETGRGSEIHNNELNNLITLCRYCHIRIHKPALRDKYWRKLNCYASPVK